MVIVGGGDGIECGLFLKKRMPQLAVTVERDPTYTECSTGFRRIVRNFRFQAFVLTQIFNKISKFILQQDQTVLDSWECGDVIIWSEFLEEYR